MAASENAHSFLASIFRGFRGLIVTPAARENPPRPEQMLELYEFEGCPFCRKVREVMSELDLNYISRTCAGGALKKRAEVAEVGGKVQFPLLVDPNRDQRLYESEDIIDYLHETYGDGRRGAMRSRVLSPLNTTGAAMATLVRPRGRRVKAGLEDREQPAALLVLYGFETSPFCRKVREALNELNLDYEVRNVAKKSYRRPELVKRGGRMMVPYLIDRNRDKEMYESDEIVAYLHKHYGP